MIRFIYYLDKSILNCFTFLLFQCLTHTYLMKASMTHNKYSTILLFEGNNFISAKSAAKILSLNLAQTIVLLNFLITSLCNS